MPLFLLAKRAEEHQRHLLSFWASRLCPSPYASFWASRLCLRAEESLWTEGRTSTEQKRPIRLRYAPLRVTVSPLFVILSVSGIAAKSKNLFGQWQSLNIIIVHSHSSEISFHSGLVLSISWFFLALIQPFNCFSRLIADFGSEYVSKYTSLWTLYLAVKPSASLFLCSYNRRFKSFVTQIYTTRLLSFDRI